MKKVIISNFCFTVFAALCITGYGQSPTALFTKQASFLSDGASNICDHQKLVAQLQEEGLITENKSFSIKVQNGVLVINDLPILETADLYKSYIEKHPTAIILTAKENNLTVKETAGENCKSKKV